MLEDLHNKLLDVIDARAADPDIQKLPGGSTGLVVRTLKSVRKGDGFEFEAAKARGFDRPWSPAVEGEGEADSFIAARSAPPPRAGEKAKEKVKDATPSESDVQADE